MSKNVSDSFRIEPRRYIKTIASRCLWRYGWIAAIPLAIVFALSLTDIRFIYLALMIIFVAYPMALMLLYYNYALKPQAVAATLNHHLEYDNDCIIVVFDEEHPLARTYDIKWSDIADYEYKGEWVLLTFFDNRIDCFLALPQRAMSDNQWQAVFDKIDVNRNKQSNNDSTV